MDNNKTVGSLYLIVIGASIFNYLITVTQLPFAVVDFINYLHHTIRNYFGYLCNLPRAKNCNGFFSYVIFNYTSFFSCNS